MHEHEKQCSNFNLRRWHKGKKTQKEHIPSTKTQYIRYFGIDREEGYENVLRKLVSQLQILIVSQFVFTSKPHQKSLSHVYLLLGSPDWQLLQPTICYESNHVSFYVFNDRPLLHSLGHLKGRIQGCKHPVIVPNFTTKNDTCTRTLQLVLNLSSIVKSIFDRFSSFSA